MRSGAFFFSHSFRLACWRCWGGFFLGRITSFVSGSSSLSDVLHCLFFTTIFFSLGSFGGVCFLLSWDTWGVFIRFWDSIVGLSGVWVVL